MDLSVRDLVWWKRGPVCVTLEVITWLLVLLKSSFPFFLAFKSVCL